MKKIIGKKLNNKGFSLVELIVAVAILALVVVPIARLFTASVRMNMISKRRLNAVDFAEDIMESIKSRGIDDLTLEFSGEKTFELLDSDIMNGASASIVNVSGAFDAGAINSASAVTAGTNINNVVLDTSTGEYTYDFTPNADGKYYYLLEDVDFQRGREKYDAIIKVDASKYRDATSADPEINYNTADLVDVATVRGKGSASYVVNVSESIGAIGQLRTLTGDATIDLSDLKREIVVDIENKNKVTLAVNFADKSSGTPIPTADVTEIYNDATVDVKNVFIFYDQNYESRAGNQLDSFRINNTSDVPVNVYIIKQDNQIPIESSPGVYDGLLPDGVWTPDTVTNLQVADTMYRVKVDIWESGYHVDHTKILTNIDYVLGTGSTTPVTVAQGTFSQRGATLSDTVKKQVVNDLADTSAQDRYFDVDIFVYRSDDTSESVYKLSGSTLE